MGITQVQSLSCFSDRHPWWQTDLRENFRDGWSSAICPVRNRKFWYHRRLNLATWKLKDFAMTVEE